MSDDKEAPKEPEPSKQTAEAGATSDETEANAADAKTADANPESAPTDASVASEGADRGQAGESADDVATEASADDQTADAPQKEGGADDESANTASTKDAAPKSGTPKKPETWINTLIWALGILAVLGVEIYIYGHDGDIEVCVGIEKLTDYSTRAEPRTKANASKHPFCAKRVNLGMWSDGEKQAEAALKEACAAASRVVGAEHRQKCLRRDDPWSRFVEKKQIPPWDPRLYRRLLWLD